ncbi:MAG: PCRF domain-containing protein [Candidatus Pacebacteria bacterium]|nr:PCRF domain-containing protein [Candidatus Paceibacterota bacterium]
MEIRAGTGGEEAALFANDLFKMYSKYAASKNWRSEILDLNDTELGGIKQIVFELKGEGTAEQMKYEAGVHRVQRVPRTEKSNRIHTSTVSVAVLPKPEQAEQIKISPADIEMDYYKSSGPGGQYVNKRQTAVRITHKPTGLVVTSQTSRSLDDNKRSALGILEAKLYEQEKNKINTALTEERRAQIGTADRSEKIRTYNFPQDRITDHRINKSWYKIEKILDGDLEKMLNQIKDQLK